MQKYIRKEVKELLGVTQSRVKVYTDMGLIPKFDKSSGKGNKREYDENDIFTLRVVFDLAYAGVPLLKIRDALNLIGEPLELAKYDTFDVDVRWKAIFLVVSGDDSGLYPVSGFQYLAQTRRDVVTFIRLDVVGAKLRAAISEYNDAKARRDGDR